MARRIILILITASGLLAGFFGLFSPAAAQPETGPTVNAVLFWSNGCPHCETVLLDKLPFIQQKYGDQLNILLVELVTLEDVKKLYALGARMGLEKEQVAVPLLVIGETALVGDVQIPDELPGLADQYLASGGIAQPVLPEMGTLLESGVPFTKFDPQQLLPAESQGFSGFGLAWAIMVLMLLSLVAAVVFIVRAFQGKALNEPSGWLAWVLPLLALVGLGIAIYLTYVEGSQAQAICGPIGDCNTVQNSRYAKIFDVIPVGLFGALGYIAILVAWLWRRTHKDTLAEIAAPAIFGMTAFGVLYSIYLTYLEIFVIHAVCIWCLSSAVIITLLMLLSLGAATRWLAAIDEEE